MLGLWPPSDLDAPVPRAAQFKGPPGPTQAPI
jgi:hypothetical protein